MDNQEKEVPESSSEDLSGKQKRWRLEVPLECKPALEDLTKKLALRSMGGPVHWLLPSQTKLKDLVDLTEELGYEKGGETIDSLLQVRSNNLLLSLTRERGFQNAAETLNWCVPNDTKRLVELTQELVFRNGAETLNCLLSNVTRPMQLEQLTSIAAVKNTPPTLSSDMNTPTEFPPVQFQTPTFRGPSCSSQEQSFITNRNPEAAALGPSAGNHSVAGHPLQVSIPEKLNANQFQGSEIHGAFPFPFTVNEQPHCQFRGSIGMVGETQQRNQIGSHSSGLQGGQTTNQCFNGNRHLGNLSNSFKRRAIEHGNYDHPGNKSPTPLPTVPGRNQIMNVSRNIVPEQGLNKKTKKNINGVEMGSDQGFQNSWLVGLQSEIEVQNNHIVLGEASSRQNYGNRYFNRAYPDVPMNPDIHHRIPTQIQFEVADWNVYQNQGGTQMGGTHGSYIGSSSKEEQKYAGTVYKLVTDKPPKRM